VKPPIPGHLLILIFSLALFAVSDAEARVFDLKDAHFAVVVGGSFGSSAESSDAYGLSSGTGTQVDKTVQTTTSGELGFLFSTNRFNLRLGGEYLVPRDQVGVNGTNAGGTQLFSLHSTVSAVIPEVTLELTPFRRPNSHGLLGLGYGYAFVSLNQQYTMTSAGQSALGVGNYTEIAAASAPLYQAYVGWEFVFTENITLSFAAGYRYLVVSSLQATQAANAISQTETSSSTLTNMDGSVRTLDLSGEFGSMNLRFYF